MNEKNHRIYSDKLRLSVVDLTQINLATEEDRLYGIDHWAALFKTTTWEELKMLAKSNQSIENAASTVYKLTQEEKIRQQCEAREDYYCRTAGQERLLREKIAEAEEANTKLEQTLSALADKDAKLTQTLSTLADKDTKLTQTLSVLADKDAELERLRKRVAELEQG